MKKVYKSAFCFVMSFIFASSIASVTFASQTEKDALEAHKQATLVDTHNDTMMKVIDKTTWMPVTNIRSNTNFHIDIPKMRQGQLDVSFFAAYTAPYLDEAKQVDYTLTNSRILSLINALHWTVRNNPDEIGMAKSVEDISRLTKDGKIAAVSTIEGAYSLNNDNAVELLRQYYDLGVRAVGMTHNYSNDLGEGVNEKYIDKTPSQGGLTELGKTVVKEMNRLGIIVDVSHLDERTFWDVIKTSNAPIIASHSGSSVLKNHVRNLTDEQIKALAKNGGVVQIPYWKALIADGDKVAMKQMVDHIDHVVKLVGVDYVGLGSDFDGAPMLTDLGTCAELPGITQELFNRGYCKSDVTKILGGNSMRVMKAVWHKENKVAGLSITPSVNMGEVLSNATPVLTATIAAAKGVEVNEYNIKAIVDGKVYKPQYDKRTQTLILEITEPLAKNYHVVTFEVSSSDGKVVREARIFYIL